MSIAWCVPIHTQPQSHRYSFDHKFITLTSTSLAHFLQIFSSKLLNKCTVCRVLHFWSAHIAPACRPTTNYIEHAWSTKSFPPLSTLQNGQTQIMSRRFKFYELLWVAVCKRFFQVFPIFLSPLCCSPVSFHTSHIINREKWVEEHRFNPSFLSLVTTVPTPSQTCTALVWSALMPTNKNLPAWLLYKSLSPYSRVSINVQQ